MTIIIFQNNSQQQNIKFYQFLIKTGIIIINSQYSLIISIKNFNSNYMTQHENVKLQQSRAKKKT